MPSQTYFDPADFTLVKSIALSFPDTEEASSHEGTPSVKLKGKLMCRLHDNGLWIVIHLGMTEREYYLETYPESFLLPDHFKAYNYIALWKDCRNQKLLKEILEQSWKSRASKKQLKDYEENRS